MALNPQEIVENVKKILNERGITKEKIQEVSNTAAEKAAPYIEIAKEKINAASETVKETVQVVKERRQGPVYTTDFTDFLDGLDADQLAALKAQLEAKTAEECCCKEEETCECKDEEACECKEEEACECKEEEPCECKEEEKPCC